MRALVLAVALLLGAPVAVGDWPMFHGDHLNRGSAASIAADTQVWWTWSTADNAHLDASPVIGDGLVVIADRSGKVTALDIESGRPLWGHTMGGAVASTPAIGLGRVYVATVAGQMVALDTRNGGVLAEASVGATRAPLTVNEGKVYVGTEAGEMKAFEGTNLDQLWSFSVTAAHDKSTYDNTTGITSCVGSTAHKARPIRGAAAVHAGVVVFASMNHYIYAVDEQGRPDGKTDLMWRVQTKDIILSSPVIDSTGSRVFIAGYDERVLNLPLLPKDAGGNKCYGTDVTQTWTYTVPGPVDASKVFSTPAYDGKRLYFGANNGAIYAIDAANGKEVWRIQTSAPVLSSPAIASATLVIGGDDGKLRYLRAGTGEVVKQYTMEAPIKSAIAVHDGTVVAASEDGVVYRLGGDPPYRADLSIASIESAGKGATIKVINKGGEPSVATILEIWDNGTLTDTFDVPALAVNESAEFFYFALGAKGSIIIEAIIDPNKGQLDAARDNNRYAEVIFLEDPSIDNQTVAAPKGSPWYAAWWLWVGLGTVMAGGGGAAFYFVRRRGDEPGLESDEFDSEDEAEEPPAAEVPDPVLEPERGPITDLGDLGEDVSDVDYEEPGLPKEFNLLDEDL